MICDQCIVNGICSKVCEELYKECNEEYKIIKLKLDLIVIEIVEMSNGYINFIDSPLMMPDLVNLRFITDIIIDKLNSNKKKYEKQLKEAQEIYDRIGLYISRLKWINRFKDIPEVIYHHHLVRQVHQTTQHSIQPPTKKKIFPKKIINYVKENLKTPNIFNYQHRK